MRLILAQKYTDKWVSGKSDAQVIVIFRRLQANGTIKV